MGAVGAHALGESLRKNTSLRALRLAGNQIDDAGTMVLQKLVAFLGVVLLVSARMSTCECCVRSYWF